MAPRVPKSGGAIGALGGSLRMAAQITNEVEMNGMKPDRLGEVEQAAAQAIEQAQAQAIAAATTEFEGEVREFVRRDVSFRQRVRPQAASDNAAENVNSLIQRVSTA